MKKFIKKFTPLFILSILCTSLQAEILQQYESQNQIDQKKIIGIWQGTLNFSGMELRLVFKISEQDDGSLVALMDSPDQGAKDIPTSNVSIKGDSLIIEASLIGGIYQGKISEDYTSITGAWKQGGYTIELDLNPVEEVPKLNRPQEPKKPYPYLEEEITYQNETAGIQLAGTLTLPDSIHQHPVVLLITGSGAQDRNETIFGHHPFWVLADYLTRQGIAVLRVDDRGVGGSTGGMALSTTQDFASDVLAGIAFLKTRKEIDPKRIGLIGHSEGGIIAPMVAAESWDVAFIVLMAGTGLTGEEILLLQTALILKANGISEATIQKNRLRQEKLFEIIKTENDDSLALEKLKQTSHEALAEISEDEKKALGIVDKNIENELKALVSPWFRYFLTYDPTPVLKKVKCPVLAINGELDLQVPPAENLGAIEQALKAGGNTQYAIEQLPKLNHLFQTAETGSPSEYGKIEETISQEALKVIGDWILLQSKKN